MSATATPSRPVVDRPGPGGRGAAVVATVAVVAATAAAVVQGARTDLLADHTALAATAIAGALGLWGLGRGSAGAGRVDAIGRVAVAALVVGLAGSAELAGAGDRADGGRVLAAHAAALAAVALAGAGTAAHRRLALGATAASQVAAAWSPTAPVRAGLVVAWLVAVVTALVADGVTADHGARVPPVPGDGGTAARRRAAREAIVVLAVVALLAPLLAGLVPPDGEGGGRSGRGDGQAPADAAAAAPIAAGRSLDSSLRFDSGDGVVMRVAAPDRDFWRGRSFDRWDGRTWTAGNEELARLRPDAGRVGLPRTVSRDWAGLERERFLQTFTMAAPGSDLMFAAAVPESAVVPEGTRWDWQGASVRFDAPLGPGDTYSVVSRRPVVTAAALREHDPARVALPPEVRGDLQVPAALPARVGELARTVTARSPTTYDAIRALEAWIGANTTYSLDVPVPPAGEDAVDRFLFVDRQGFCVQIASSLAVMLRTIGVPARVAVGYAGGEEDRVAGTFTVRQSDAHAWVEVWFPGLGWQAFDPTADVPLSGEDRESWLEELSDLVHALRWYLAALAVALVAVVAWRSLAGAVARRRNRRWEQVLAERLGRAGRRRGRPRAAHETVPEYARALAAGVLADPRVEDLAAAISAAAFSAHPSEAGAGRVWAAVLADVERAHPPPPRRPGRAACRRSGPRAPHAGTGSRTSASPGPPGAL